MRKALTFQKYSVFAPAHLKAPVSRSRQLFCEFWFPFRRHSLATSEDQPLRIAQSHCAAATDLQKSYIVAPETAVTGAKKAKVIVISGPTAVGKTELSLLLAEQLRGEIISADSVQVYRGLDIGSAKVDSCTGTSLQLVFLTIEPVSQIGQ